MLKKLGNLINNNKFIFTETNLFIFFVLLLASVLRFVVITKVPPSLNWDEVSHGYNAYSILKTGKDEWGISFPTIFRAYGDYKLPVYIYLTVISEAFFGLTTLAIRLPSILAGIAIVFFTYLLTKKLYNEKAALVSSLLVAVEPWSFFLSRGAFEANLSLALIVSGFYLFVGGFNKPKLLPISALLLGLSVWTYNSYRIFTPLMLVALIVIYRRFFSNLYRNKSTIIHYSLSIILFFLLPMFYQLANTAGQARYSKVAIIDEGAVAQINESRTLSKYSLAVSRIIYNKGTYFVSQFSKNYFSHFSLNFLALKGGSHYQFSVPNHGLIYTINIVFFLLGLLWLFKSRSKESFFILMWLILSPIPASLTREAPHVLRAITMLPIPMIITALGFIFFLGWLKEKKLIQSVATIIYLGILFVSVENYLTLYFTEYKKDYSWSWQYGYENVVDYAKENYDKYDSIIVTKKYGEPHEFFLLFWPWDPEAYRTDPNLNRFYQSNWYWVDGFGKFYFVNDWEIPTTKDEDFILESGGSVRCSEDSVRCLLVTSPGNSPNGWNQLETINFLDGSPVFEIYEY